MSNEIFQKLYESSKLLVSSNNQDQVPVLQRGLDQIDTETRRLFGKHKTDQEQKANAHYFLAQNGINSHDLTQQLESIDTSRIFEPADTITDTDVEKYLQQAHEHIIIETIEECRESTCDDFEELNDNVMQGNWKNAQRRILEEWDHHQDTGMFTRDDKFMGITMTPAFRKRVDEYADIIGKLNDARIKNQPFPLIDNLSQLSKPSDPTRVQDRAMDAWQLVNDLASEASRAGLDQHGPLQVPPTNAFSINLCKALIDTSKRWLERQFVQYVDEVLYKNARETQVGGVPSPILRIKAFMNYVFRKNSGWTDPRFEVVNDTPIWTYVYLLVRSGHEKLALKYVEENEQLFDTEPRFRHYFREYVDSPEKRLRKPTRDAVLADYQRLEYGQQSVDPYKLILYKIIGRCELNKKSLPDVVATTEDYVWLQLSLVRESAGGEESAYEQYRLSDLQSMMVKFGSKRFDPNGSSPWNYFKVLLLTLQFERAVNYLYKNEKCRLDAVHCAIALAYTGLLRIPDEPLTASIDLLIIGDDGRASFNFARLIYQYIRVFSTSNPQSSLHYIYLLTLYAKRQWYDSDDMFTLCYQYIRGLVLSSKEPNIILGKTSTSLGRQDGLIDRHKTLIGITNEHKYVEAILMPIAEKYSQEGRYMEAVSVYELTSDYNKVADILNKQLGDALQQPRTADRDQTIEHQTSSDEELINFSINTLRSYEQQQHIGMFIKESKKNTAIILISLLRCRSLYDSGAYEQALQIIRETEVIPLQDNFAVIQRAADRFNHIDDAISKNMPDMLLMVTDMLYKLWTTFTGPQMAMQPAAKQTISIIEENIRAILAFVGIIQFKMPADTITKLNRAEMIITGQRHH
ncbi:nucleoporin-interacting protein nic96 [Lichtheimia corymbifera JMRC:FSU:9682]|uniref:Nuclear pore protein n=1 Tax=Lichtheimia corymbifera JMRC:FSU:9682 TaxID=1263082 RepID=A0A068RSQ5_9FUNG|nr:nucleoporin-interacting protein nic96 [Lichtheimia corymbifera JMRC:FSU:9682]